MATRQAYVLIDGVWTLTGGPPGPQGIPGPQGPPGLSTAVTLSANATFTLSTTTTEPTQPAAQGLFRFNSLSHATASKIWVSNMTAAGMDVTSGLERITVGSEVYVQDYDTPTSWAVYEVTLNSIFKTTYFELTVSNRSVSTTPVSTGTVELISINPGSIGVPPGGVTGQVLTKSSGSNYATSWQAPTGGGGSGHTIRDEGTALTARAGLNFTGPAISATDDSANNRTNVTVSTPNIIVLGPTDPVPGGTPAGTVILRTP